MQNFNKLIIGLLLSALVLSACVPEAQQPTEAPYLIEEAETPSQTLDHDKVQDLSGNAAYDAEPTASAESIKALASGNNAFALELYQQLSAETGNIFYSPYSIYQALLMTYAGASGETAAQMESTLRLPDTSVQVHTTMNALNLALQAGITPEGEAAFELNVANALWGQQAYPFKQSFLDLLSSNYDAGLKTLDFSDPEAARALINLWVEAQTNDKIRDLIPDGVLNDMTRLVLTNAVYFKAAWLKQFDPTRTQDAPFTLDDGSTVQVPMMHQTLATEMMLAENLEMVSMPYKDGRYSMLILMPEQGGLEDFEKDLTLGKLDDLLNRLEPAEVVLGMPKFKLESAFGLSDQMQALGMQDAFDASMADFSEMDGSKNLFISALLHKAFVDVNEEGTEAAAATAVMVSLKGMPTEQYEISIDHPFLFLIREEQTGTIIFMGRVMTP